MKTQRTADTAAGLFLAGLGLVVIISSFKITSAMAERLPPQTLPLLFGFTTLSAGILLALKSWHFKGPDPAIEWPEREGWMRVIVTFVSLFVYLYLIEPIGMPLASLAFTAFLIWYMDRRLMRAVIIGVAMAAILLFGFIRGLELTFPVGPLQW